MSELAKRDCVPCNGGVPPLKGIDLEPLRTQIDPEWTVVDEHHLSRLYRFKSFAPALAFVNRVGGIAEAQNHHPDIYLAWGRARIEIWTHKIDGLTESDFIFAAKCDEAFDASE
ncbi:MAG TPA: 4a-hydroxytetrahydrobiopterin dehydratase [Candidatus Binatia bacterium]|nr:4a-hydroxytetrahydrobiopterin dehydratase [Candidatus Binatia bacterium]